MPLGVEDMMDFEDDYTYLASDILSKMRLVLEGAVTLLEDEVCPVYKQIRKSRETAALLAFDDIGTALYELRQYVRQLQAAHHLEAVQQADTLKSV